MAFMYQTERNTDLQIGLFITRFDDCYRETYHEIFIKTKVCLAQNNQRVTRSSKTCGGCLHSNSSPFSSQMSGARTSPYSLWLASTKALTKAIWSGPRVLLAGKASTPSPCAWGEQVLSKDQCHLWKGHKKDNIVSGNISCVKNMNPQPCQVQPALDKRANREDEGNGVGHCHERCGEWKQRRGMRNIFCKCKNMNSFIVQ